MAYSSDSDLTKEISSAELAKLTGDPSGVMIDTNRTAHSRANADAIIDAYLSGIYTVPFTDTVPTIIKKLSIDLTLSNLYENAYQLSSVPYTMVVVKANAIRLLKDIQKGYAAVIGREKLSPAASPVISNKDASTRQFDEITLSILTD